MSGLLVSSSQNMALMGHASAHLPHPMHFVESSITPPPSLSLRASTGHTRRHGGSRHALQTITVKPRSMPPVERARIADFANPPEPNRLLQANMQSWHPTHRSESTTSRRVKLCIFLFTSFRACYIKYPHGFGAWKTLTWVSRPSARPQGVSCLWEICSIRGVIDVSYSSIISMLALGTITRLPSSSSTSRTRTSDSVSTV